MHPTTIIGVDCATNDAKVGLSIGIVDSDRCVIRFASTWSSERKVAEEVAVSLTKSMRVLIAFDAPLGWPRSMGQALVTHRAGEPLEFDAHTLFRRETDRFIKLHLDKQSLDVGADRIARTAHSALKLLAELRLKSGLEIPLAWSSDFTARAAAIEVYPAATLVAHNIPGTGYKKKEKIAERQAILSRLESLVVLPEDQEAMLSCADPLDAAICVLAGFDFLRNTAYPPEDATIAESEGWIWARRRVANDVRLDR